MRQIKIVADSSANMSTLKAVDFSVAPLKIHTSQRAFVDTEDLNVSDMITYFDRYSGPSKTSCPAPSDWLTAFGEAQDVVCVTITSGFPMAHVEIEECRGLCSYYAERGGLLIGFEKQ